MPNLLGSSQFVDWLVVLGLTVLVDWLVVLGLTVLKDGIAVCIRPSKKRDLIDEKNKCQPTPLLAATASTVGPSLLLSN